jgi:uncharacterized protein (DUF1800 family)
MRPAPVRVLSAICIASLLVPSLPAAASAQSAPPRMDEIKRAAHALNRLAFGPRPGDIAKVEAIGVDKWIELQLHPEKIDDSALEARLAPFRTLKMIAKEMVESFPPPQVLKQIADGKRSMPSDPKRRAIYESQIQAYKEKQERKTEKGGNDQAVDAFFDDMDRGARRKEALATTEQIEKLSPDERFATILKMPADERRAMATALNPEECQQLTNGMSAEQREELMAMARPQQVITNELTNAKLLRAIYSERQLEEVMTDFWFNHFNVFINKGADRYLTTSYERDVIRKHALGKFEDLLVATAQHPAMLFYLDNFQSVGPDSPAARGERGRGGARLGRANRRRLNASAPQNQLPRDERMADEELVPPPKPKRGLNENYARELMELHTLGVDGGYTQKDVTEVAKVFTGWTVRQPRMGGGFEFRPQLHEPGNKTVLGKTIHDAGESEGREVLHMLATHPSTAKFISKKLAMRFVSDDPPPALVDGMAATFTKTHGDIREVLRRLFKSPEFWAPEVYRAKVKTPFEFVISSVRASGAEVTDAAQLGQTLNRMGMPLYGMQPPTGYSMKAESWVNSAALINRMNFSLALSAGKIRGVTVDPNQLAGGSADPNAAMDTLAKALLNGDVSQQTKDTISKQAAEPGMTAGLLLGSPEFQRR